MLFKNEVANLALGILGVSDNITDLDNEYTEVAKIIRRHIRHSMDYLLEMHHWNFARKTQVLTKASDDPEQAYNYSYYAPGDCLVIRQLGYNGYFPEGEDLHINDQVHFEEVYVGGSRLIYTNLSLAWAKYTRRVAESEGFPQSFGRALAGQIALDTAPSIITGNYPKLKDALYGEANGWIEKGIADDIARTPQRIISDSPFLKVRY